MKYSSSALVHLVQWKMLVSVVLPIFIVLLALMQTFWHIWSHSSLTDAALTPLTLCPFHCHTEGSSEWNSMHQIASLFHLRILVSWNWNAELASFLSCNGEAELNKYANSWNNDYNLEKCWAAILLLRFKQKMWEMCRTMKTGNSPETGVLFYISWAMADELYLLLGPVLPIVFFKHLFLSVF